MSSNDHYIVDYQKFGGIKLYKVHGFMGDYIELDNSVVERKVCSLEEARSGKHKFYAINEQIQNIAQKKDTLCRRMYN